MSQNHVLRETYELIAVQLPPGLMIQYSKRGWVQPVVVRTLISVRLPEGSVPVTVPELTSSAVTPVHGTDPKVNWSAELVALVPEGVVTVTSTVPAACGGLVVVIVLSVLELIG